MDKGPKMSCGVISMREIEVISHLTRNDMFPNNRWRGGEVRHSNVPKFRVFFLRMGGFGDFHTYGRAY